MGMEARASQHQQTTEGAGGEQPGTASITDTSFCVAALEEGPG